MISHVIEDIVQKGTTGNYSTRPGEAFIQEVKEAYNQTNERDPEAQVHSPVLGCDQLATNTDNMADGKNK